MYNEVLKYGSYIVDALVAYEQPVFVYIPPFGELRGGSWVSYCAFLSTYKQYTDILQVVIDPTINPQCMEMYADEDSRGGVLEPDGIIGIKFRRDRQLETMARLDPTYGDLKRQLADKSLTSDQQSEIKVKMTVREQLLLPVYAQIAWQYADLHDRAGRMEAKGVIRKALQWQNARRFFYWRLRRRLNEDYILKRMAAVGPKELINRESNIQTLKAWSGIPDFANDDMSVATWYEENRKDIHSRIEQLKTDAIAYEVAAMMRSNKDGGLKGVAQVLSMLPLEEKENVLEMLRKA